MFDGIPGGKARQQTFRAPMMALSSPDPVLQLPKTLTLQPRVFLRNTTAANLPLQLQMNWLSRTRSGVAPITIPALNPGEVRIVDLSQVAASANVPADANWATVVLSYNGITGDVVPLAISYDSTGQYSMQTPFISGVSYMWKGGQWEVDSTHDTLLTVGNAGSADTQAAVSFIFNGGTKRYELPVRTLHSGEQGFVDFADVIAKQVPDANGNVIPLGATSGSYEVAEPGITTIGHLYESKLHIDKTYGHSTYGCASCCGTTIAQLVVDPLALVPIDSSALSFMGNNACTGSWYDETGVSYGWGTVNTSIATASAATVYGVNVGSTNAYASADLTAPNPDPTFQGGTGCVTETFNPRSTVDVTPVITSISPSAAMVGSNGVQITISGSGFSTSPTVNLPSGFTLTGQASSDSQIIITVDISINTTISDVNFTVTANGQTSKPATFTADGPNHMVVQSDQMGLCSGCTTTVARFVKYQVVNKSGSLPGAIQMCETPAVTNWSCQQSNPGMNYDQCTSPTAISADSTFTDLWSISSDAYTPTGCGFDVVDNWRWGTPTATPVIGTLSGYIHTNAVKINGYVNPPSALPQGTVINP